MNRLYFCHPSKVSLLKIFFYTYSYYDYPSSACLWPVHAFLHHYTEVVLS